MKSIQISEYGGVDVLHLTEDTPKPSPKSNQVLVEVYGATINPFDYKLRSGIGIPLNFPVTVGGDFAGKVVEFGGGITEFSVGDEVFGSAIVLSGGSGAFAEFATANTGNIAKKPKNISLLEAASLPVVGSSAVQALEEHIGLKKSDKILIHGGAGGIGSLAIQLAKHLGAYVAATVRGEDAEFVKALGADEVIDYKTQKFEEILHDFDAAYDTVGGETTTQSFKVLRKGGTLVSMLGEPDKKLAESYGVKGIGQGTQINTAYLSRVAELVEAGVLKPQIEKVFPLEEVQEAFRYQEEVHPRGKIVVKIRQ